jgi:plasmanylethanolamine desaturase
LIVEILICVLIADFLTGLIHWWEDTYGLPSWPILGKLVIEPNIQHHLDPTFMVRMGSMVSRNWQTVALAIAGGFVLYLNGLLSWQAGLILGLSSIGNEVHAWSHSKKNNFLVRLLQDMCLIQTPNHHSKHHKPPYSARFCTLTNWVNPVLDRIHFWGTIEFSLGCFGIRPNRLSPQRNFV